MSQHVYTGLNANSNLTELSLKTKDAHLPVIKKINCTFTSSKSILIQVFNISFQTILNTLESKQPVFFFRKLDLA